MTYSCRCALFDTDVEGDTGSKQPARSTALIAKKSAGEQGPGIVAFLCEDLLEPRTIGLIT